MSLRLAVLVALLLAATQSAAAASGPAFSSAHALLLKPSALPAGYRYHGVSTDDSVWSWDGGIQQIVAIDQRNGWLEAAQESAVDRRHHEVMLSAQLFQTAAGARSDFGQFFTNQHPETIYEPGTYWRGAVSIRLGDRATLYHIEDDGSRCPRHLTTGLSFVFGNALFSVGVCSLPSGDSQSRDLAQRLLAHARIVKR